MMLGWSKEYNSQAIAGAAKPIEEIAIPYQTVTPLPLKSILFDQGNFFDDDGKVKIKKNGIYIITGVINFQVNPTGTRWAFIRRNGNDLITGGMSAPNPQGEATTSTTTVIIAKLVKGDYLELCGYHLSQTSNSVKIYPTNSQLSIARLGD